MEHKNLVKDNWDTFCERKKYCHPFERPWVIRLKTIVIHSNGPGYPFKKNCHPFEQLELSVQKY